MEPHATTRIGRPRRSHVFKLRLSSAELDILDERARGFISRSAFARRLLLAGHAPSPVRTTRVLALLEAVQPAIEVARAAGFDGAAGRATEALAALLDELGAR